MITGDPKKGRPLSCNGNETEVFKVFMVLNVLKDFNSQSRKKSQPHLKSAADCL